MRMKVTATKRQRSEEDDEEPKFKVHNTGIVRTNFIDYNPFTVLQDEAGASPSIVIQEPTIEVDTSNSPGTLPVCSLEQMSSVYVYPVGQTEVAISSSSPKRVEADVLVSSLMEVIPNSPQNLLVSQETTDDTSQKTERKQANDLSRPLKAVEEELFLSASSLPEGASSAEVVKSSTPLPIKNEKTLVRKKNVTILTKLPQPIQVRKNLPIKEAVVPKFSLPKN